MENIEKLEKMIEESFDLRSKIDNEFFIASELMEDVNSVVLSNWREISTTLYTTWNQDYKILSNPLASYTDRFNALKSCNEIQEFLEYKWKKKK